MGENNGFDTLGPWFDGVKLLTQKQPSIIDAGKIKNKPIAIIGAGMSGLMTYLILRQQGFSNITILEADHRLGGRVHTVYLSGGPFDYSYQEMGAMRIPFDYIDPESKTRYKISEMQLVFSLINELNEINKNLSQYRIDLIPWYEHDENGLRYFRGFRLPGGLPPGIRQIEKDQMLSATSMLDA
ncbi:hypothetical protein QQS21_005231 [Conoideocrella luteorostrata]|uniref:Amine oxidase domain-containing protein n=1 Tax=Conoideocrella luteorostrata TaxID=1105319 RepID=A0AAJ0CPY1_9HYPO|nr:hypothetical protein QQS21_005231 [Conoideocrella luteorostrata]